LETGHDVNSLKTHIVNVTGAIVLLHDLTIVGEKIAAMFWFFTCGFSAI
jgi:hypothetical protein